MNNSFLQNWFGIYLQKRLVIIGLFGFSSGIPYFLTASSLAIWLEEIGYGYATVGFFMSASLPHSLRFLWAPFIDRMPLPFLTRYFGRRRAWMLASQVGLMGSLLSFFFFGPSIILTMITTFFAATQETVLLTYQLETLPKPQFGPGEAIGITGARLGMLLGGAGAIYLSSFISWNLVYAIMAACVSIGMATILLIKEPNPVINAETLLQEKKMSEYLYAHPDIPTQLATLGSWIYAAVLCPFYEFMTRKGWIAALGVMFLYKLGDNIIGPMPNLMYLELGYTKPEIAEATKLFGMITSIIGGLFGGVLIVKLGFLRGLLYFGAIHMAATIMYIVTYNAGYNMSVLYTAVALEHFTAGMRTAALFAFQLTLCNSIYAATQLALLMSLISFGRTVFSSFSGVLVTYLGWVHFYNVAILASIPALLICVYLLKLNEETLFGKKTIQLN